MEKKDEEKIVKKRKKREEEEITADLNKADRPPGGVEIS